jgi:hypothetical protein
MLLVAQAPGMNQERESWCRTNTRQLAVALVAAAVIIVAALVAKGYPRGSGARIALALVEGIATAVCVVFPVWSLRHLDELQRRIQLEALAIAFVGTGVLGAGYGFLQSAGLPPIDWGAFLWPAMVGLWAIGYAVASRRYR